MTINKQVLEYTKNAKEYFNSNSGVLNTINKTKDGIYYTNGIFYYNNIAIARFYKDKNGGTILFVTSNIIYPQSAKLLEDIINTSGLDASRIYHIPQTMGALHSFDEEGIFKASVSRLKTLYKAIEGVLTCKAFTRFYEQTSALSENVFSNWNLEDKEWVKIKKIYNKIYKRVGEAIKRVNEYCDKQDYKTLVNITFFGDEAEELKDIIDYKTLMRRYLDKSGTLSFLKVADGAVRFAEKGLGDEYKWIMALDDAEQLTDAVVDGTIARGQKYGDYTIMGVSEDKERIRISCKVFTKEMLTIVNEDIKALKK